MWYCRICTLWTESTTPSKNFWVANTDLWYIIILQRFHISIILCSFQALLCSSLLRCSKSLVLFGEKRKKAYDGAAAADHVSLLRFLFPFMLPLPMCHASCSEIQSSIYDWSIWRYVTCFSPPTICCLSED